MGRKASEGANTPPSGASSPADPHRHPRYPKSAQGGGPRPIQDQGPWQPGAAHQTPQQRKKLPHPIIQSVPKLHKTIRHPGKARLPRLYWTPPPCGGTDASKTPTPEPGQAHAPTHAPGGTPTRTQAPQAQP